MGDVTKEQWHHQHTKVGYLVAEHLDQWEGSQGVHRHSERISLCSALIRIGWGLDKYRNLMDIYRRLSTYTNRVHSCHKWIVRDDVFFE